MRTFQLSLGCFTLAILASATALGRGPDDDVANFLKMLKDPKTQQFAKNNLAEEIGKRAAESKIAVPALVELLKDAENARFAARGLGAAGPAAREAVDPLLAILKDPAQAKAHAPVISAIGKIKPADCKAFIEAITPVFANADQNARRSAIEALGEIGPGAKAGAALLYPLLKDPAAADRGGNAMGIIKTLGLMQPDPKDALPVLVPFLDHKDGFLALEAKKAYLRVAPDTDEKAIVLSNDLVTAYKNKGNRNARGEATAAIEDLGPHAKFAVPALMEVVEGKDFADRGTALRILTKMGPEAKDAIPSILKAAAVKDNWPIALGNLLNVIPLIGGKKADQLPILIAVLEDYVSPEGKYHPKPKAFPQPWQGEMLGRIRELGPDGVPAAAAVAKLVEYHQVNRDGGQTIIVQAMQTLGEMGPGAKEAALPVLLKAKGDFTADQAIKKITDPTVAVKPPDPANPLDKPKVPSDKPIEPAKPAVDAEKVKALIAGLNDPAPAKRKEAIEAIAAAGVAGRAAESELIKLLRDPDLEIRLLAAYALEKIETGK